MTSLPRISILVPLHNAEGHILHCLQSIIEQTYLGELECIIVNDCSVDNSMSLVASFLNNYNGSVKFYILNHAYSRGLAACQNTALDYVSGLFLIHLYPNERLSSVAIETLVRHQQEMRVDIVSSKGLGFFGGRVDDIISEPPMSKSDMIIRAINYPLRISCRLIRTSLYFENNIRAVEGVDQMNLSSTLPKLVFCSNNVAMIPYPLWDRYYEPNDSKDLLLCFIQATDVLIEYFAGHDRYLNELYKKKITYVKGMLSEALYASDKEGYNRALGKLKDIPRRYFHHTKLKDIWQNFLLHHYSIRKMVQDYQHRRKS